MKSVPGDDSEYLIQSFPHQVDLVVASAKGTKITDASGKDYLDLFAGIAVNNVGHCHPKVVAAVREQAGLFMHVSNYYHSGVMPLLAQRLAEVAPKGLRRSFFSNSGSEAIDGSVKLAKKYAYARGKNGSTLISLEGSFHGRLALTLSLTGQNKYKEHLGHYASYPGIFHAPAPYHYRRGGNLTPDEFGKVCANEMAELVDNYAPGDVAAVLIEPIMGEGGIITPPDTYLPRIQQICRERQILLAIDEIQSGVARSGRMFASQLWGIEPDIMAFAKGIGGGLPLGGFIATDDVASAFQEGDHFSTFGGNPVACAAAIATLEVIKEERLEENARKVGDHTMRTLKEMGEKQPLIGEVRGKGLMIGVELVKDSKKTPASKEAAKVKSLMKERGFLIGVGGLYGNVLRLEPPLIISKREIDFGVAAMETAIREAGR